MSLLSRGNSWLEGKRPTATATAVTYKRGATTVSLNATPNRTEAATIGGDGNELRSEQWEWLIRTADLASLSPAVPKIGDRILRTIGGDVHEFVVVAAGGTGGISWRYADDDQLTIRVFTIWDKAT